MKSYSSVLLIIPTYNEKESLSLLIPEIKSQYPDIHILVVDDNSPDQTADTVNKLKERFEGLNVLKREKKEGLGPAYREGFKWALHFSYMKIIQMDADGSHRVADLGRILDGLSQADFVVGSRLVAGGSVKNWEWYRRLLSWGGNAYARLVLGFRLRDWTGGFNGWNRRVLDQIGSLSNQSQGYSFQIEMKFNALRLNFSPLEVPIIFEERRAGHSKMSPAIIFEALRQVWQLRLKQKKIKINSLLFF